MNEIATAIPIMQGMPKPKTGKTSDAPADFMAFLQTALTQGENGADAKPNLANNLTEEAQTAPAVREETKESPEADLALSLSGMMQLFITNPADTAKAQTQQQVDIQNAAEAQKSMDLLIAKSPSQMVNVLKAAEQENAKMAVEEIGIPENLNLETAAQELMQQAPAQGSQNQHPAQELSTESLQTSTLAQEAPSINDLNLQRQIEATAAKNQAQPVINTESQKGNAPKADSEEVSLKFSEIAKEANAQSAPDIKETATLAQREGQATREEASAKANDKGQEIQLQNLGVQNKGAEGVNLYSGLENDVTAMVKQADVANQVYEVLQAKPQQGGIQTFTMQLKPESLGEITVTLSLDKNKMKVLISTENLTAKEILQEQLPWLRAALDNQSANVHEVYVEMKPQSQAQEFWAGTQYFGRQNSSDQNKQKPRYGQELESQSNEGQYTILNESALNYLI